MSHERREVRYYQDRISQLEAENRKMKGSLHYTPTTKDLLTDTIYDISAKNQRLQREAEKYQNEIKRSLTSFIRESRLTNECLFKKKYMQALNRPQTVKFNFTR